VTQYFRASFIKYASVVLVVLVAPSFVSDVMARKPAPVIEASGEPAGAAPAADSLEKRLQRLERLLENRTLLDLMTRIDNLQNEVRQMLGQTEEQAYNMEQLKKRQRDLYLDIDRRLRELETARASLSVVPAASAVAAPGGGMSEPATTDVASPANVDSQEERAAYGRAFNLLKEGRYDLAVAAFKAFVRTYPQGQFVDNAQYWLGEANYVQRNFAVALSEFDKVVKNHPASPKRADALLKMGYTFQELDQNDNARISLNKVVTNYPNTTAARLAQKRLQDLKQYP